MFLAETPNPQKSIVNTSGGQNLQFYLRPKKQGVGGNQIQNGVGR